MRRGQQQIGFYDEHLPFFIKERGGKVEIVSGNFTWRSLTLKGR